MEEYGNTIGNPNAKQFKLLTRYTRETISKQMPNDIEVLDILPDTVFFQFANIVSKKVPIKPNVKLEFEEQCMLNGAITFTPDSILVKGPNTILDTLKGIYCKFQKFDGLEKTLQRNVALVEIKTLEYDKKRTIIQLPVSKFTEASFEVPIQARNIPDTLDLKTFPRMTKVSFLIALDDYNKIQTKDFVAVVDYADIANLLGSKLSLKLELTPKNVQSIRYFPESVEFILDKK